MTQLTRHHLHFYRYEYSPDEGGYYAEVFNSSGQTIHTTQIKGDSWQAVQAARRWINRRERPYRNQQELVGSLAYRLAEMDTNDGTAVDECKRELEAQQAKEREMFDELHYSEVQP